MFRFEKLQAWQKAMDWAQQVYAATSRFPDDERYGLTAQLRRAAVSVCSNIAEGSGRVSDREFAHFVGLSYGSLMEALCQCKLAVRLDYLSESDLSGLECGAEELSRMLSGLRSALVGSREVRDNGDAAPYLAEDP